MKIIARISWRGLQHSYAEIIARLTAQFETGHFQLSELYGFWLPLFQVAAAILNLFIHSPIVAGNSPRNGLSSERSLAAGRGPQTHRVDPRADA